MNGNDNLPLSKPESFETRTIKSNSFRCHLFSRVLVFRISAFSVQQSASLKKRSTILCIVQYFFPISLAPYVLSNNPQQLKASLGIYNKR